MNTGVSLLCIPITYQRVQYYKIEEGRLSQALPAVQDSNFVCLYDVSVYTNVLMSGSKCSTLKHQVIVFILEKSLLIGA